ncbi:polyprenyl synthetase family protein [Aquincola tertiaricarbonis]|uniref:polyprenyl synthetase family protein n=1 Tax=Aquincola tertiaricarbonis TaxID=391953 RepID=UPI000698A69E|nr:polyprenyl synthetase family protein [Aquincola tertiaricarbonis]
MPETHLMPPQPRCAPAAAAPGPTAVGGAQPWPALVDRINQRLDELLPLVPHASSQPNPLAPAMRHAVLGMGKRVRALLALQAARELEADDAMALDAGCAIEMLHAASLVLDDLPAMDDAPLRRGQPATHLVFGEATAMLTAVSLIARAFALVGGLTQVSAEARCAMVAVLACTIGSEGMSAGQQCDVAPAPGRANLRLVEQVGEQKTGSLFVAAVELGALAGQASAAQRARLRSYAQHVGLAFQIADDLVDEDEDTGRDTYVGLLGRGGAQALLRKHVQAARGELLQPRGGLMQLTHALFAAHLGPQERMP